MLGEMSPRRWMLALSYISYSEYLYMYFFFNINFSVFLEDNQFWGLFSALIECEKG